MRDTVYGVFDFFWCTFELCLHKTAIGCVFQTKPATDSERSLLCQLIGKSLPITAEAGGAVELTAGSPKNTLM
jgi:hypothetical protein